MGNAPTTVKEYDATAKTVLHYIDGAKSGQGLLHMSFGKYAMATVFLLCSLTAVLSGEQGTAGGDPDEPKAGGRQAQLDIEVETSGGDVELTSGGTLVGCLRPALRAAGVDWSSEYLWGYIGRAFAFSMKEDGGRLVQADEYEWSYFYEMLDFLNQDLISVALRGNRAVPQAEHTRTKAEAWEKVRRAIDDGYPAIVWQAMSAETRNSGQHPIPWLWSLITGYDEGAETYAVHHIGAGEFTIPWDGFGHADPVNWFCVMIFRPLAEPFDADAASRSAIEHAIEASQGKRPGDHHGSAHGLAAWELWLKAFQDGSVSVADVAYHSDFLIDSRTAAAVYLTEIEPHFPESANTPLREAAGQYDEVVDAVSDLRDLSVGGALDLQKGAEILAKAFEHERAAVASLQRVLEAR